MKKIVLIFSLLIIGTVIALYLTQRETPASVEEDLAAIKDDISEVKKELGEIKRLLQSRPQRPQRPPTPTEAKAEVDDDPFLGDTNAPVTLIEFSDYQCPYCGRFFQTTLPQLKKEYIDTGKLKYVFRDFPLPFHQQAQKASEAAQCAGDQGKYWEMHDLIFKNQRAMQVEDLKGYAENLGLNKANFDKCLDGDKYTEEVKKDMADGRKVGVRGTPSFVLGKSTKDGKIDGKFLRGAQSYQSFKEEIDSLLKGS